LVEKKKRGGMGEKRKGELGLISICRGGEKRNKE